MLEKTQPESLIEPSHPAWFGRKKIEGILCMALITLLGYVCVGICTLTCVRVYLCLHMLRLFLIMALRENLWRV